MRVFIAGVDGYLGWSLAMYLTKRGHEVAGADCYHRRDWVAEMGSQSATPIKRMTDRLQAFREGFGTNLHFIRGDMTDYNFVWNFFRAFEAPRSKLRGIFDREEVYHFQIRSLTPQPPAHRAYAPAGKLRGMRSLLRFNQRLLST